MKQILSVRSNAYYSQEDNQTDFALRPLLEIVIICVDGKNYKMSKNGIVGDPKLTEHRMIVSPEMLQILITDLQLHQKKLDTIRKNADQLSALVNHINTGPQG